MTPPIRVWLASHDDEHEDRRHHHLVRARSEEEARRLASAVLPYWHNGDPSLTPIPEPNVADWLPVVGVWLVEVSPSVGAEL